MSPAFTPQGDKVLKNSTSLETVWSWGQHHWYSPTPAPSRGKDSSPQAGGWQHQYENHCFIQLWTQTSISKNTIPREQLLEKFSCCNACGCQGQFTHLPEWIFGFEYMMTAPSPSFCQVSSQTQTKKVFKKDFVSFLAPKCWRETSHVFADGLMIRLGTPVPCHVRSSYIPNQFMHHINNYAKEQQKHTLNWEKNSHKASWKSSLSKNCMVWLHIRNLSNKRRLCKFFFFLKKWDKFFFSKHEKHMELVNMLGIS